MKLRLYLQILSLIVITLIGLFIIMPKYTFDNDGHKRKNRFTGIVEKIKDGRWIRNDYQTIYDKIKFLPSKDNKKDDLSDIGGVVLEDDLGILNQQ